MLIMLTVVKFVVRRPDDSRFAVTIVQHSLPGFFKIGTVCRFKCANRTGPTVEHPFSQATLTVVDSCKVRHA